eukprot:CAMPEP_0170330864 /NCGR_PEP_ID=MMETSP0116_2-20130129/66384_1 /TAXON_ID=400756 /ORGANISM="Durinskia baltica, Strain CSIRO CS-38" /LENGTH=129 /DNA_ID=CAMNT_0010584071 /DNA_START=260 /DNA_END=649 /DNA_ORIENTATION=-
MKPVLPADLQALFCMSAVTSIKKPQAQPAQPMKSVARRGVSSFKASCMYTGNAVIKHQIPWINQYTRKGPGLCFTFSKRLSPYFQARTAKKEPNRNDQMSTHSEHTCCRTESGAPSSPAKARALKISAQ